MSTKVSSETRDAVMEQLLSNPQNRICFDCKSKDPKWASPYLGIFICYECTARHRGYGTHISFVRSIDLDDWNKKQLKSIELTGNQYTFEKFTQMGIPQSGGVFDYQSPLVIKIRSELANRVEMILSQSQSQGQNKSQLPNQPNAKQKENAEQAQAQETQVKSKEVIEENEEPKEAYKEPTKFNIKEIEPSSSSSASASTSQMTNIKSQGKAGKKNQIKKAEFDFDFDTFDDIDFNQFNKEEATPDPEPIKKNKDEDMEEKENQKENSGAFKAYDIKISEEEVKKKFANKKAISSDDYAALEDNGNEAKYYNNKIKQMGNCSSISSNDVYGIQEEPSGVSLGTKLKETALYYTLAAAEKAKAIKNQTTSYINKVQNKFGGNN